MIKIPLDISDKICNGGSHHSSSNIHISISSQGGNSELQLSSKQDMSFTVN